MLCGMPAARAKICHVTIAYYLSSPITMRRRIRLTKAHLALLLIDTLCTTQFFQSHWLECTRAPYS
jgi:hypothetical protein